MPLFMSSKRDLQMRETGKTEVAALWICIGSKDHFYPQFQERSVSHDDGWLCSNFGWTAGDSSDLSGTRLWRQAQSQCKEKVKHPVLVLLFSSKGKWECGKECDRKDGQKEPEQICSLAWKGRMWACLTKPSLWREAWEHWHGAAAMCDSYWKSALSEVWLICVVHVESHCLGEVEDEPQGLIARFFPGVPWVSSLLKVFLTEQHWESHEKCCSSELACLLCRTAEHWLSTCTEKKAGRSCFCGLNVSRGPGRCRFRSNFCGRLTKEVWVACLSCLTLEEYRFPLLLSCPIQIWFLPVGEICLRWQWHNAKTKGSSHKQCLCMLVLLHSCF